MLAGGGIATGVALASSGEPAAPTAPAASSATHAKGARPRAAAAEVVTAVTSGSVTVDTKRGSTSFTLNSATTYREGKAEVTASAVQVGEKVRIRIVPGTASSPVAQAVTILPAPAAKASTTA